MRLIGQFVGGLVIVYLLSKLIEWLIVSRLMARGMASGLIAISVTYLLASFLYGFGAANGGPWVATGFLLYLPGALVVTMIRMAKEI